MRGPLEEIAQLALIFRDGFSRLSKKGTVEVTVASVTWRAWSQVWPSTACGFPVPATAQATVAQTVLLLWGSVALVYHDGTFAYHVEIPSGEFFDAVEAYNLPGAVDWPAFMPRMERPLHRPYMEGSRVREGVGR